MIRDQKIKKSYPITNVQIPEKLEFKIILWYQKALTRNGATNWAWVGHIPFSYITFSKSGDSIPRGFKSRYPIDKNIIRVISI